MQADVARERKERLRETWTAGNFGRIARYGAEAAAEMVSGLPIPAGARVLDVACGTGNISLPAARGGAKVTGLDIAPNLLEEARQRAAEEGLEARFDEGDAEQLPYPDGEFDVVLGIFGAMFSPHPNRIADELTRVCRKGGTIIMANWSSQGFIGGIFDLGRRYMPPPAELPSPVLWGDGKVVRRRLGDRVSSIRTALRVFPFDFPYSPAGVVELFRQNFPPTVLMHSHLDAADWASYAADFEALWQRYNRAGPGHTSVQAEYLEVVAER